jgi:hypothetical protein
LRGCVVALEQVPTRRSNDQQEEKERADAAHAPIVICTSSRQHLFDERKRARILRLTEPKERLFAYLAVPLSAGNIDQLRNTLVPRQLREGKHRLLLNLGIGIVFDGIGDGRRGSLSGLLR